MDELGAQLERHAAHEAARLAHAPAEAHRVRLEHDNVARGAEAVHAAQARRAREAGDAAPDDDNAGVPRPHIAR